MSLNFRAILAKLRTFMGTNFVKLTAEFEEK